MSGSIKDHCLAMKQCPELAPGNALSCQCLPQPHRGLVQWLVRKYIRPRAERSAKPCEA